MLKPSKNIQNKKKKEHINRSGIEPVIGYQNKVIDHRNYIKGILDTSMNLVFSGPVLNFKQRRAWPTVAILPWVHLFNYFQRVYWHVYDLIYKVTFGEFSIKCFA